MHKTLLEAQKHLSITQHVQAIRNVEVKQHETADTWALKKKEQFLIVQPNAWN